MKKITLLLCFIAFTAMGQNHLTLQDYVDAGLQKEIVSQEKPDGYVSSVQSRGCLLYTSPSPRDQRGSRMPSSA